MRVTYYYDAYPLRFFSTGEYYDDYMSEMT